MLAGISNFFSPVKGGSMLGTANPLTNLNKEQQKSFSSVPKLTNCRAEDYPCPPKYLDGAPIPTMFNFQSNMVTDEDLRPGMIRQLEVDKRLTVPTRTHIRILLTATDVIHSFAVPALGLKLDCTPGRICKTYTFIQREGVYYGQCSELWGALHAFMPIVMEAISPEAYAKHAKKWYVD